MSDIRSEPLICRMCGCFMIDVLEGEEAPCKDGRHRYICTGCHACAITNDAHKPITWALANEIDVLIMFEFLETREKHVL